MRLLSMFLLLAGLLTGFATIPQARAHDPIVIGVPHWPSAEVTAHIIAQTIRTEFGTHAELKQSGTLGIFKGIEAGRIQVHPEIWLPNLSALVQRYAVDGDSLRLSPRGVAASQNICTTPATVAATGLSKLTELADPAMARNFDTNGDGRGEIWIGAPTWSSTPIEEVRARSYGYDRTMDLLEAPEDVAMANVDASIAVGRPVVFYCYAPHHIFKLHEIVTLEEPVHDPKTWNIVLPGEDPAWLVKSSAGSAWDAAHFHIGYAAELARSHPRVARFLENVAFAPEDIVQMAFSVSVERQTPEAVAQVWIAANRDRIEEWIQ